ncbi:MAG: tripartite tricarboxylate transporter substrate binding protein [Ramlibacter sp.]|nr:tripartite tricarboxylate transporter substrate binding protein [Ramlibacter sp.]
MRKLPYDPRKDFRPLSAVVRVPLILAVPADSPHKTVREFVEWARKEGDKLNYGSTGIGGSSHLASEYFNQLAGTKIQHIPYAGGGPLVTGFAGGQVHMAFVTGLDGAAMVQAGKIRYLAVASPKRTDVLPGLPAIAEDVPGFRAVVWFGVLGPSSMPDAIANKVSNAIAAAVLDASGAQAICRSQRGALWQHAAGVAKAHRFRNRTVGPRDQEGEHYGLITCPS